MITKRKALQILIQAASNDTRGSGMGYRITTEAWREKVKVAIKKLGSLFLKKKKEGDKMAAEICNECKEPVSNCGCVTKEEKMITYGVWDNWGKRFLLADSGHTFKTEDYSVAMMAKTRLENDGAVGLEIRQMSEDWMFSERLVVMEEK